MKNIFEKFSEPLDKNKIYKCPICHSEVKGRRGLTIHLKRKHFDDKGKHQLTKIHQVGSKPKDWSRDRFDKNIELKVQELVLKTVYGMAKVNSVITDYVNGKYTMKTLPINIGYYIRLKGIKPDKEDKSNEKTPEKKSPVKI